MEIQPDIDVFVGNSTYIDFDIFRFWLQQIDAGEAANQYARIKYLDKEAVDKHQPFYYVLDQYRTFGMLEQMLCFPHILGNQLTYQVSPEAQRKLITKYFEFDELVIRELLGKKLSKGTRRDLDEISMKSQVRLKSCQRQFDNCRRVFKAMEDITGSVVESIQLQFLLPIDQAWSYAAIVFLSNHRFECSKRKLATMNFDDFIQCAKCLIKEWTNVSTACSDVDLDQDFLHELRGVKLLIADQRLFDLHKTVTRQAVANAQGDDVSSQWCDSIFRQISRAIVSIATGLYKTKEIRDYFVDLVEKVVDPCRAHGLEKDKLKLFLTCYTSTAAEFSQMQLFKLSWNRYLVTTSTCLLQIYRL